VEEFGHIAFSEHEQIGIFLKEILRKWHVELRLSSRSEAGSPHLRPARSVIDLPLEQLPMLLDRLTRIRDTCVKRGLLGGQAAPEVFTMGRGEPVALRDGSRVRGHRARQHPRMPVRYAILCQTVATEHSPRSMILQGEFRDISVGGAQVWLPSRLELGQLVDVAGMLDGQPFRARAEVVGAGLQVRKGVNGGLVRHSLKWLTYNAAAADILTMTLVQPAGGELEEGEQPSESSTRDQAAAPAFGGD